MGGVLSSGSGTCERGLCLFRKGLSGPSAPQELREQATLGFHTAFGGAAALMGVAPGRAEVLGNHTDYNEGFILAAAIDRYVVVAGRRAPDERGSRCRVASESFPGAPIEFDAALQPEAFATKNKQSGNKAWANYVIGVVSELRKLGVKIGGFDAFLSSNVPPGAGVSSSAAVEMATALLLKGLFPEALGQYDQLALVKVAKAAENNFVGMGCGILDQFSSGMGQSGSLIYLDCRTLDCSYVPMAGAQFVLANTHAPHALVDGKYDELRKDCFAAKDAFVTASGDKSITHLRDVNAEMLATHGSKLSHSQRKRASHIITENDRVFQGVEACKAGDMETLGKCMSDSHVSSRDFFGNSCRELDIMQKLAFGIEGHLGSRLMGGGFGGSTINLVKDEHVEAFVAELSKRYEAEAKIKPTVLICSTGDGAFCEAL
mmetsp:Transcript_82544/g.209938  ORF Transcript_82544/g.209938 Transcript_82544/m.209938 type:complete len:432 (+) Transcript_82544:76-1371(+)